MLRSDASLRVRRSVAEGVLISAALGSRVVKVDRIIPKLYILKCREETLRILLIFVALLLVSPFSRDLRAELNSGAVHAPKYPLPQFLAGTTTQGDYDKWLSIKAFTLFRADKRRERPCALGGSISGYKKRIHDAVVSGGIVDPFTGDTLRWDLIHKWNDLQNKGRGNFMKEFSLLPTVDHKDPEAKEIEFEICSWLINGCKSDQTPQEFVETCRKIVLYRHVQKLAEHTASADALGGHIKIYVPPEFLTGICTQKMYEKWLDAHAESLYVRDRNQHRPYALTSSKALYKMAIHHAVCASGPCDPYTGDRMKWELMGTWDIIKGHGQPESYKKEYYLLPTIDHVNPWADVLEFEICSWRINCCKGDLTPDEFVEVCRRVGER